MVLHIEDYQELLEDLEELESIRAFGSAKASGQPAIPLEQPIAEIQPDCK